MNHKYQIGDLVLIGPPIGECYSSYEDGELYHPADMDNYADMVATILEYENEEDDDELDWYHLNVDGRHWIWSTEWFSPYFDAPEDETLNGLAELL